MSESWAEKVMGSESSRVITLLKVDLTPRLVYVPPNNARSVTQGRSFLTLNKFQIRAQRKFETLVSCLELDF